MDKLYNILENENSYPSELFNNEFIKGCMNDKLDLRSMLEFNYSIAKVLYDKAELISSKFFFKQALECAKMPQDISRIFKIIGFLIRIASETLKAQEAKELVEQAEQLLERYSTEVPSLPNEYFYNLGIVKHYKGEFDKALGEYNYSCTKAKANEDFQLGSKCLLVNALAYYKKSEFGKSLESLQKLDKMLKGITKDYILGSMHFYTGKIYYKQNQFDKALDSFTKASKSWNRKRCWNQQGYLQLWRGIVYKSMGKYETAMICFNHVIEYVENSDFKRLYDLVMWEIQDAQDNNVDIYLDRDKRLIKDMDLGTIDFKHRFVLLEILFLLAKNAGDYFDKERLTRAIWDEEYNPLIHDKLIYTSMSRLRKLVEPKNRTHGKRKYIIRDKKGYTFNPEVKIKFFIEDKENFSQSDIANVDISSPV